MPAKLDPISQLNYGWPKGENDWATGMDENLRRIGVLLQNGIKSHTTQVPASPAVGDLYIVPPSATGLWAGKDGQIATWEAATWFFVVPRNGLIMYNTTTKDILVYNGSTWVSVVATDPTYAAFKAAYDAFVTSVLQWRNHTYVSTQLLVDQRTPKWYYDTYGLCTKDEFTQSNFNGLNLNWCTVSTMISHGGASNGHIRQLAFCRDNRVFYRLSVSDTDWGAWVELAKRDEVALLNVSNVFTTRQIMQSAMIDTNNYASFSLFSSGQADTNYRAALFENATNSTYLLQRKKHPIGSEPDQVLQYFSKESGTFAMLTSTVSAAIKLTASSYTTTTAQAANAVINADGTVYRSTSSERFKTDIEPIQDEYADAVIFGATPIFYRSLCDVDDTSRSWWGFSAEKIAEIDPRLVFWKHEDIIETVAPQLHILREPDDEYPDGLSHVDEYREVTVTKLDEPVPDGVAYERFVPHLVNVIQRLEKRIRDLEQLVDVNNKE